MGGRAGAWEGAVVLLFERNGLLRGQFEVSCSCPCGGERWEGADGGRVAGEREEGRGGEDLAERGGERVHGPCRDVVITGVSWSSDSQLLSVAVSCGGGGDARRETREAVQVRAGGTGGAGPSITRAAVR